MSSEYKKITSVEMIPNGASFFVDLVIDYRRPKTDYTKDYNCNLPIVELRVPFSKKDICSEGRFRLRPDWARIELSSGPTDLPRKQSEGMSIDRETCEIVMPLNLWCIDVHNEMPNKEDFESLVRTTVAHYLIHRLAQGITMVTGEDGFCYAALDYNLRADKIELESLLIHCRLSETETATTKQTEKK